ncbi:MAG: response regulator [Pirellulales bacterium]
MLLSTMSEQAPNGSIGTPCNQMEQTQKLVADMFGRWVSRFSRRNETRTAYDGEEAIEISESFRPDVILLDIGLPRLNGYETCRRIRALPYGSKTTIIAQTGWDQEDDRQRTREAGFDHHLVKPVNISELMKLLVDLKPNES